VVEWDLITRSNQPSAFPQFCILRFGKEGSSTLTLDEGCAASLGVSIEEVTLLAKNCKMGSKGKKKVGTSVWADAGTALARANEVFTPEEMKEILGVPSHEMVSHHVHKLV